MIGVVIKGTQFGKEVKVSSIGELITRSFDYSIPIFKNLDTDDAAFNFFKPKAGFKFVITDIIADADRNVGNLGATVDIYEANADDSTTIDTQILKFDIPKQTSKVLTGLNFITTDEGKFINAKSDDSNVLLTISGFFIPI
ncbi:MAG: hypothetical protein IH948_04640 [Bacteroidetes bacterium]|nr:hypothetical protein [Bacteroidota bacterium]